jgi:glucosamine-6-phosphate deaminase
MGRAASDAFATAVGEAVSDHGAARVILASAPSQWTFWQAVLTRTDVPWPVVTVFQMDEYVGVAPTDQWSLRDQIWRGLLVHVQPAALVDMCGNCGDPLAESGRIAQLLSVAPIDVCVLGIGENGHLAFNDPPAKPSDSESVLVVRLADSGRRQQVHEGHFAELSDVPTHAITLSISTMLAARVVLAVVPDQRKAKAVRDALEGPIAPSCPASYLRTVATKLFIEPASATALVKEQIVEGVRPRS